MFMGSQSIRHDLATEQQQSLSFLENRDEYLQMKEVEML